MRGTSESLNLWRGSMDHRQAWVYTWSSVNPVQLRTPTLALSNTKQQSESHTRAATGGNKKVEIIWSVSMRATGLWFEPWARSRVFWSRGRLPQFAGSCLKWCKSNWSKVLSYREFRISIVENSDSSYSVLMSKQTTKVFQRNSKRPRI